MRGMDGQKLFTTVGEPAVAAVSQSDHDPANTEICGRWPACRRSFVTQDTLDAYFATQTRADAYFATRTRAGKPPMAHQTTMGVSGRVLT